MQRFVDLEASPLSGTACDNLMALAELMGLIRYFHPSDQAFVAFWDEWAIEAIARVEGADGPEALANALSEAIAGIAPSVTVVARGLKAPPAKGAARKRRAGEKLLSWHHHGLSHSGPFAFFFSSDRVLSPGSETEESYTADLTGGVTCAVPIRLPLGDNRTQPALPLPVRKSPASELSVENRTTRLAIVMLSWAALRHFFPYQDIVEIDWGRLLRESLLAASAASFEEDFFDVLCRMVHVLEDGHARAHHPSRDEWQASSPPIAWSWIEGKLVVTVVRRTGNVGFSFQPDYLAEIKPGDVVLQIDGVDTAQALEKMSELVSGSTAEWVQYRALERLLAGPRNSRVLLKIKTATAVKDVELYRTVPMWSAPFKRTIPEPRPDKIAQLEPGVMYVDLTRVTNAELADALPKLEKARGIVFDIRGYPPPQDLALTFIGYFTDETMLSANFMTPVITHPDATKNTFLWQHSVFEPLAPRISAKLAFITDRRAISYAETLIGVVDNYRLGAIVGERTAGCNGAPVFLNLPCGYVITWTGMVVTKHDGATHYGVGIIPTHAVSPTIAGVACGRDELLDRALSVVSE